MTKVPRPETLRFYGARTDAQPLAWEWVDAQLTSAGTYWVVPAVDARPRPVWGTWTAPVLHCTIGSPAIIAALASDPRVTVHLDSGIDVVIVEGTGALDRDDAAVAEFVRAYDEKYDWVYDLAQYGPPVRIEVRTVLAWRAAGAAGRDGFREAGKWTFG